MERGLYIAGGCTLLAACAVLGLWLSERSRDDLRVCLFSASPGWLEGVGKSFWTKRGRWSTGKQMRWETKDKVSKARWAKVAKTLPRTSWACPPASVRLPPKTLRFTTRGRTACSAGQFVASMSGS